jgi:hypothetical protein
VNPLTRKTIIVLISFLHTLLMVYGQETVYISPFSTISAEEGLTFSQDEQDLYKTVFEYMDGRSYPKAFVVKLLSDRIEFLNTIVRNHEEAEAVALKLGKGYIVSGYIYKAKEECKIGLTLYNGKTGEQVKNFYKAVSVKEIKTAMINLSQKVMNELYLLYQVPEKEIKKIGFSPASYLGVRYGFGYHVPLGDFWRVQTGIADTEVSLLGENIPALAKSSNFAFSLRPGISVHYQVSLNKPEYLFNLFQSLQFILSVETLQTFYKRYVIHQTLGGLVNLDIIYRNEQFRGESFSNAVAPGLLMGIGYEYWLGEKMLTGIGFNNRFVFVFYSDRFYADYSLMLYVSHRFPKRL